MKYLLVKATDDRVLNEKVQLAIQKGFVPIGGIAMQSMSSFRGEFIIYAQAMVQHENNDKEIKWDNT